MIVMHRHLGEAEAGVLQLLDQLQADRAIGQFQVDHVEDLAPHQPKIAVDIAQLEAEHGFDEMVIQPADDLAMQRVGATDFVAVDHIDPRQHMRHQQLQLARIVLRIAVGVEDQLLGSAGKPDPQSAAVAEHFAVRHHAQLLVALRQILQHFHGVVGAAVLDDDHFVVVGQLGQRMQCRHDQAAYRPAVVVSREKCRDAWPLDTRGGRLGCHIAPHYSRPRSFFPDRNAKTQ